MFRGRWNEKENSRNATVNYSTSGTSATDEVSLLLVAEDYFFLKECVFVLLLATNVQQIVQGKKLLFLCTKFCPEYVVVERI